MSSRTQTEVAVASPATLGALEFASLLALVADFAATDLGRAAIGALAPHADRAGLDRERAAYTEAAQLAAADGDLLPAVGEAPGAALAALARTDVALGGLQILALAEMLRGARRAQERILAAEPPCPVLAAAAARLPDLRPVTARIERVLDRRGEVRDDASPRLAALRRRVLRGREQLYGALASWRERLRDELAEETVPMRGGRLVLMLQTGARGRAAGLVHGRSATGKSVYFEPLELVEPNNELQQAVEDEAGERQRLLAELVALLRDELAPLAEQAAFVGWLDRLAASRRFAAACEARLPDLAPAGHLRLVAARHPLLEPRLAELRERVLGQAGHRGVAVPLDVELAPDQRALVLTGPNAGGKTVALKTVGLLTLAAQSGLPIPAAAGSEVPFCARVEAAVGDEQDLLAERSTFSGRLARLREVWEAAGPESLALLDELGSGTDPDEGAALAVALLEELLERGGLALVTTHLTRLAAAAVELPGAACAAMEFDPASHRPTYRLRPGPPGGSEALALARRLGLPASLVDRAEAHLGPEQRDYRRLLGELERVRQELAAATVRAEAQAAEAELAAARAEREREALASERRTLGSRLRGELEEFRGETRRRLAAEVERVRAEAAAGRRRAVAEEATARLFAAAPVPAEPEVVAGPIAVGDEVQHRGLGWRGRLARLEGNVAEVVVRGKRLHCAAAELAPAVGAGRAERPSRPAAAARVPMRPAPAAAAAELGADACPPELKLIGERVEAALELLDVYLDRALGAGRGTVRIVHGHGTGRLRQALREHLRAHPAVVAARPGAPNEGGNGATIVELRS